MLADSTTTEPKAVEAVEDEVEPELELGLVVAPAQGGGGVVVGDLLEHRGQVGELAGDVRGRGGGITGSGPAARVEQFLGEPQRPASQRVQRVVSEVVGEAAVAHDPEPGIVVPDDRRAGGGAGLEQA